MSLRDMLCKSVEDVVKAAPIPGRYAVWSRDKWDAPEFLDLWFIPNDDGIKERWWFSVEQNMSIADGRLIGCTIEPDWRPV